MKQISMRILALATCLASPAAMAGYIDGNKLHDWALASKRMDDGTSDKESVSDSYDTQRFRFYIAGVVDTTDGISVCISDNVKISQLAAIVSKFLFDHPETWDKLGSTIVHRAIQEVFPCANHKSK